MIQDIQYLLKCQVCESQLDETGKALPCGESICANCALAMLGKVDESTQKYSCAACNKEHTLSGDELPPCKMAIKLMQLKPRAIFRGQAYNQYIKSLENLKQLSTSFDNQLKNEDSLVQTYFQKLKDQVIASKEAAHEHLESLANTMITEIEGNESQTLLAYRQNEEREAAKKENVELVNRVLTYQENADFEVECDLINDDKMLKRKADDTDELADNLRKKSKAYHSSLFNGKILSFAPNDSFTKDSTLLGSLQHIESVANNELDTSLHANIEGIVEHLLIASVINIYYHSFFFFFFFFLYSDDPAKASLKMYFKVTQFKWRLESEHLKRIISKTHTLNGLDWCVEVAMRRKGFLGIYVHCYNNRITGIIQ